MKTRYLKRAKLEVSEISFGCMSLGMDQKTNNYLIRSAIEAGVNYFDTADLYQKGNNEISLGKAIKGLREDVLIATKVGNRWNNDGKTWEWVPRKNYIIQACEDSLRRLGIEQIDIYQLHGGTAEDDLDEVTEAFELLKSRGLIRFYGLSSIRPNVFMHFAKRSQMVSNMMQYSLLDRRPEPYLDSLSELGVGVMVRGGLAKGILAGKELSSYLDNTIQDLESLIDKLKLFSIEKMDLSHVALQWILRKSAVTSVVVGIRTIEQLHALTSFSDSYSLSSEQLNELSATLSPATYTEHLI